MLLWLRWLLGEGVTERCDFCRDLYSPENLLLVRYGKVRERWCASCVKNLALAGSETRWKLRRLMEGW